VNVWPHPGPHHGEGGIGNVWFVIDLTTRGTMLTQRALFDGFWHPSFAKKLHAFAKKLWQLKAAGKKRSYGFFPPSLPNALNPPQSYGGRVIFAKELSMIVRFW